MEIVEKTTTTTTVANMKTTTKSPRAAHAANVGAASIAIFLVIMAVLLWRLEVGNDPAIGTATAQAAQPEVVRRKLIIKRKVIVVTEDRPAVASTSTGSGSVATAAAPSSSAPAASAPAPVQSAPTPAPAPTTSAS